MIFRTDEQKADPEWLWHRTDRSFFAAGACHMLAHQFLKMNEGDGFHPMMVIPDSGFRGSHVFSSDGQVVFDYHGFSNHERFVAHYAIVIRRFFPDWRGSILDISDTFWTEGWFTQFPHRRLCQFSHDPTERARLFVKSVKRPNKPLETNPDGMSQS